MAANERKKILFVASECVPFIKTGGLADVVGSLPKDIDPEYYDVRVMIPKYSCMKQEVKDQMEYVTSLSISSTTRDSSLQISLIRMIRFLRSPDSPISPRLACPLFSRSVSVLI